MLFFVFFPVSVCLFFFLCFFLPSFLRSFLPLFSFFPPALETSRPCRHHASQQLHFAPPVRNSGMIRFPCKNQQTMVSTIVANWCERISSITSHQRCLLSFYAFLKPLFIESLGLTRLGGFPVVHGVFPAGKRRRRGGIRRPRRRFRRDQGSQVPPSNPRAAFG